MAQSETRDKPVLISVLQQNATRSSVLASSLRLLTMLVQSARSVVKGTQSQRRFNVQFAQFCRSALLAREAWEHAVANSSCITKRRWNNTSDSYINPICSDNTNNEKGRSCNLTYTSSITSASKSLDNDMTSNEKNVGSQTVQIGRSANNLQPLKQNALPFTMSSTTSAHTHINNYADLHNNQDKREKQIDYYRTHGVSEAALLKQIASYVASQTPHLGRRYVQHIALGVLHKPKRTQTPTHNAAKGSTPLQLNKKKPVLISPPSSSSLLLQHGTTHANRCGEYHLAHRRQRESNGDEKQLDKVDNTTLCNTNNQPAKKKSTPDKRVGNECSSELSCNAPISHFVPGDNSEHVFTQQRADVASPFASDHLGQLDEEITHRVALGIVMQEAKQAAQSNTHSSTMLSSISTASQTRTAFDTPANMIITTMQQDKRTSANDNNISTHKARNAVEEGVFVSHYRRDVRSRQIKGSHTAHPSQASHARLPLPCESYDLRDPAQKLSVIPELNYRVQPWAAPVPSLAGVALDRVVLDKMERRSRIPVTTSSPSRLVAGSGSGIHFRPSTLPQSLQLVHKGVHPNEEEKNKKSPWKKGVPHKSQQAQQKPQQYEFKCQHRQECHKLSQQQQQRSEISAHQKQQRVKPMCELQQHNEMNGFNNTDVPSLLEICNMQLPTQLFHAWQRRQSARVKFWNTTLQSATRVHAIDTKAKTQDNDNNKIQLNEIQPFAAVEHKANELPQSIVATVQTKRVNQKSHFSDSSTLPADAFFLSRHVKENVSMPWSLMVNHIHYGLSHLELPYAKR